MSVKIVPKDIINSAKYFKGDIFEWDHKNASDNITNHKAKGVNGKFDATWVPLYFKKIDDQGNMTKVQITSLDVANVLNSSKPSKPSIENEDNNNKIKCMLIVFKRVTPEEVRTGDYLPKIKNTVEEQEVENKRVDELVQMLCDNTNELADAQDAIDEGFKILGEKISEEYVKNSDQFKFNMAKEKNWVITDKSGNIKMFNPPIRSIKQTHRKDEKNPNKTIPLDTPIYRLKLPVTDNKMLISWRSKSGVQETAEYIYDARKTIFDKRTNHPTLVPAKIKNVYGNLQSLTVDNVDKFITNRSILSFRLSMPKLVISKQGISLVNEIKQLVVKRHKSVSVQRESCVSSLTLAAIKGSESDNDNDDDVVEDVPELDVKESKNSSDNENNNNNNDDGNITDSSEEEEEVKPVSKPVVKKPVLTRKAPVKRSLKKNVESDDDLSE
jgi:hypothetical protein